MNSSSNRDRVRVLRAAEVTRSNVSPADLGTVRAAIARDLVVDRRLVDEAVADGFRNGYEAGFQSGIAEARAAGAEMAKQRLVQLHGVVQQLEQAADALRVRETASTEAMEAEIVRSAYRIAEVLVGHELRHSDTLGRDAILRALQLAPKDGLVTARLNPDDADALNDIDSIAPGRSLRVVADDTIQPGDCIVEVAGCHVDARVDEALARVRSMLGLDA